MVVQAHPDVCGFNPGIGDTDSARDLFEGMFLPVIWSGISLALMGALGGYISGALTAAQRTLLARENGSLGPNTVVNKLTQI